MLYIDYGNINKVPKRMLRMMPLNLQNIPAAARRIKLGNIMPFDTPDWTMQAKMQIDDLIFGKPVDLVVHAWVGSNFKVSP